MRLYHSRFYYYLIAILVLLSISISGCTAPQKTQSQISIAIIADGGERIISVSPGSTVQQVLSLANVSLSDLDRIDPPQYTVLTDGAKIRIVRVREEFTVEQVVIPFQHQTLRNESMPEGESRLVQPGVNGSQEITYRRVYEDGKEISNSPVKQIVVEEATPEIVMVGSQAPFASFSIPGKLAYLLAGNVWLIEGDTGNRRPVITSGDLDGWVFSLSPDSDWLLYTRRATESGKTNELWVAKLPNEAGSPIEAIDLKISNVHFADWQPGGYYVIAYSTVEPRPSAPGWQANNDLYLIKLTSGGQVDVPEPELETNMGGQYGWWGMTFTWAPDGKRLAYGRPDGLGLLQLGTKGALTPLLDLISLQTGSDWAWVPGLGWGPDGKVIYTIDHVANPGSSSPEQSPFFDLIAIPLEGGPPVRLVSQVGMFAYPLPSPILNRATDKNDYQVAFLQAIFPNQSESSRYRLLIMDRDGSNSHIIFPVEGAPGLDPMNGWGAWSPAALQDSGNFALAIIYQNKLWLVDVATGEARQITGDDMVSRVDWK